MAFSSSREPANLGRQSNINPLKLEPGMFIWDRFCVVGKVRHASPLWSVLVTDLQREFGRPPHHRVNVQYLPGANQGERLRRAVAADREVQPLVRATIDLPRGIALIHEPVAGERLGAQLPAREARALALALTGLVHRLHEAEVHGIGLRANALRQSEGRFRLDGFAHLFGAGSAEQDIEGLLGLLRRTASQHLAELLEPPPADAAELWDRAQALAHDHGAPSSALSQHPPFVCREDAWRELERAYADAQIARSSLMLVCGPQGVGKTRLIEEFGNWLRAKERAVVLRGEYLRGCGESRAGLMGALNQLPGALTDDGPSERREEVRARIHRRTGALAPVLASYAPGLSQLLEIDAEADALGDDAPNVEFEEGFARHAVAVAEGVRAIGTQTHPLVILLDNLQLADRGSIAVLRRLLLEARSHHTMVVAGLCGAAPSGLADANEEGNWNPQRDPQLLLRRIELDPFTVPELERLLVAGLPGPVGRPSELAESLHHSSHGNTLVAWATLQTWIDEDVLERGESGAWNFQRRRASGSTPRRVFTQRVERASLDQRWLGLLAALAGGHVDEAWFQRVSGWTTSRVASAVTGLERHGLMGKVGETSLRFPHELVRDLFVEVAPPEELRRAHKSIAGWLASLGPRVSPARLAYHTDRALGQASSDDPHLAEMHLAAGREMLGVFDLERSGWHFTRALVERTKGGSRLAAIEGAADVALLGEKYDEAAQYYAEAVLEADDALVATRIAAKAVHGLYRKAAAVEAATIGRLALARSDRPLPDPGLRQRTATLEAKLRLAVGGDHHELDEPVREQLCWLYARMAVVLRLPAPASAELCLLRALRHARGLDHGAASNVIAQHGVSLAIRGKIDEAREQLERSINLAAAVDNDWALALAQHLRGQMLELPLGDYRQGLACLDQAVTHFRRTGDLSVAVSSLFFKAVYSRDRAALPIVHGWLDEATALNEVQNDAIVDLAIEALRLLLRARVGARNIVEAVASVAARAAKRELVSYESYLTYAFLGLALLEVGEQGRGRELLAIAHERAVLRPRMPEFAYELWVAQATILARTRAPAETRRLDDALRVLDRAGRRYPRVAAQTQVVRMRRALAAGQPDQAAAAAKALISGFANHGQTYLVLEAHQALGELLRGSDVLAAREHVHLAQGLAEQLGLEQARERERERERSAEIQDIPRPRLEDRSSRRHSNAYLRALARNELVDVAEVLEGSRQVLQETLGHVSWLYLRAEPNLRVFGELLELQSLLVHLALCARDSVVEPEQLRAVGTLEQLEPERAAEIPGANAGPWGRIAVTVAGTPTSVGVTGGVSACRQVATRLGGFLDIEQDGELLTLAVYLPPERGAKPGSSDDAGDDGGDSETDDDEGGRVISLASEPRYEGVYVLHPDAIIRETLTAAITRLGFRCQDGAPDETDFRELPPVQVLFADAETLREQTAQLPHVPRIVELGSRIVRPGSKYPNLRVPFALGELRNLLEFE